MNTSSGNGALQGLKVVDLTRVLAGPRCTQILSDHGADVVKVEPPSGDETRRLGPPFDSAGSAAYFSALNRGKRSIGLDLSKPEAQEVLHRLLAVADVLVPMDRVEMALPARIGGYTDFFASIHHANPNAIFLNANENAFGSPLGDHLHRYPDMEQLTLKTKISSIKGVPPKNIFLGNGSDEVIDVTIRVFCEPGATPGLRAEDRYSHPFHMPRHRRQIGMRNHPSTSRCTLTCTERL